MAIARAGRERGTGRAARRDRRLGVLNGEAVGPALQRMALGQVDEAIGLLNGPQVDERAIHDTRKALKRLRAIVRLLEGGLGHRTARRETRVLGDVAALLSGARDADVMLATLDALVERERRRLSGRGSIKRLRRRLHDERVRASSAAMGDPAKRARALAELHGFRERVERWRLPDCGGLSLIEPGLLALYRDGRSRYHKLERAGGDRTRAMHRWRRRVKDLRYVAETLDRPELPASARERVLLRRIASRADDLGELLGEEHDLSVLADWVARNGRRGPRKGRIGRSAQRDLLRAITRRRRTLRSRAMREGSELYARSPKRFVKRIARAAANVS